MLAKLICTRFSRFRNCPARPFDGDYPILSFLPSAELRLTLYLQLGFENDVPHRAVLVGDAIKRQLDRLCSELIRAIGRRKRVVE